MLARCDAEMSMQTTHTHINDNKTVLVQNSFNTVTAEYRMMHGHLLSVGSRAECLEYSTHKSGPGLGNGKLMYVHWMEGQRGECSKYTFCKFGKRFFFFDSVVKTEFF